MGGRRRPDREREGKRGGGGTDLAAPPGKASPARGQSRSQRFRFRERMRASEPIPSQYRGLELCIREPVSWPRGGRGAELVPNSTTQY
jgi:hypothetical protein